MNKATSVNDIPIRLTDERWEHITTEHTELSEMRNTVLEVVSNPDRIFAGSLEELLAVKQVDSNKWMVVVYREIEDDGFIITAFVTSRYKSLERRQIVWSSQK